MHIVFGLAARTTANLPQYREPLAKEEGRR
jgi:hypothetical protein